MSLNQEAIDSNTLLIEEGRDMFFQCVITVKLSYGMAS